MMMSRACHDPHVIDEALPDTMKPPLVGCTLRPTEVGHTFGSDANERDGSSALGECSWAAGRTGPGSTDCGLRLALENE
jgi:hypothetical protein